jgi:hypothetical protein
LARGAPATDILGNPNAPFINAYVGVANQATNYFAVGHPSAPNYLEIVGGSNFGVSDDYWPNWTNGGCKDNSPGSTGCKGAVTPIAGSGTDNTVVATAMTQNDCNGQIENWTAPVTNDCALYTYPATMYVGKSIAHQLVQHSRSWKTYQESLPIVGQQGVYGINYADGAFSNLSPAGVFNADGGTTIVGKAEVPLGFAGGFVPTRNRIFEVAGATPCARPPRRSPSRRPPPENTPSRRRLWRRLLFPILISERATVAFSAEGGWKNTGVEMRPPWQRSPQA